MGTLLRSELFRIRKRPQSWLMLALAALFVAFIYGGMTVGTFFASPQNADDLRETLAFDHLRDFGEIEMPAVRSAGDGPVARPDVDLDGIETIGAGPGDEIGERHRLDADERGESDLHESAINSIGSCAERAGKRAYGCPGRRLMLLLLRRGCGA